MIDLHGCVNHVVQCRCTSCTAAPSARQLSSVQIQSLVLEFYLLLQKHSSHFYLVSPVILLVPCALHT